MAAATRAAAGRRLQDLPAPRGLPLLGNLHQLDPKRLHAQLEAWCDALGSTYTFKLGLKAHIVTSDVEIALSVLRNRPGRFRRLSTIASVLPAKTGSPTVSSRLRERHGARSAILSCAQWPRINSRAFSPPCS